MRVAALVTVLVLAACGADVDVDTTGVDAGSDAGDSASPTSPTVDVPCEEQRADLVANLKGDVLDDYQPTASPVELANSYSEYVVRADTVSGLTFDDGRVTMTLDDVTVLPVHELDLVQPLTIEWWTTGADRAVIEGLAVDRVSVVAFIEEAGGVYRPLVEGLYVGCGDDGPASPLIADPVGADWPTGADLTLATLVTAVLDPAALDPKPSGRQADGTFVSGPLTCYTDLFEDTTSDFADGDVGAPTPEEAVELWWARGDGRFRTNRSALAESWDGAEVRYSDDRGNTQLALGLRELSAGGWVVDRYSACADPALQGDGTAPDAPPPDAADDPGAANGPDRVDVAADFVDRLAGGAVEAAAELWSGYPYPETEKPARLQDFAEQNTWLANGRLFFDALDASSFAGREAMTVVAIIDVDHRGATAVLVDGAGVIQRLQDPADLPAPPVVRPAEVVVPSTPVEGSVVAYLDSVPIPSGQITVDWTTDSTTISIPPGPGDGAPRLLVVSMSTPELPTVLALLVE